MPTFIEGAKSPFVTDVHGINTLLVDNIIAEFYKKAISDKLVTVEIGFPKTGFKTPCIQISCPSYQCVAPLGYRVGKKNEETKLQFHEDIDSKTGLITKVRTNIADTDPAKLEIGFQSTATVKISVYNHNYDSMHLLAQEVIGLMLCNYDTYFTKLDKHSDFFKNDPEAAPKFMGCHLNNIMVDYNQDIAGVSNLYVTSFFLTMPYTVRIQQRYTYITAIREEQTLKENLSEEVISIVTRE